MAVDSSSTYRVGKFIDFIREANELLQQEIDLSPDNQRVTSMIKRLSLQLRSRYLPEEVQAVLSHEYVRRNQRSMQAKLSEAESLAELNDSCHICSSSNPVMDILKGLPVWNIYKSLVCEELSVLHGMTQQVDQSANSPIVFVGSGPLPLSSIILHLYGKVDVVCLEMDLTAYEASCALLDRMGLRKYVTVLLENGLEFDYSSYSRIFVASLVRNKFEVLEQISRTSTKPLVAVRTAEGMKQIMYEAADEQQFNQQGWRIIARTTPDEKIVINSTLFLDRANS